MIKELDQVVELIKNTFGDKLCAIILYGSYARGDATPESDVDIGIIVRNGSMEESKLWQKLKDFNHFFEVRFIDEKRTHKPDPYVREVLNGKWLYKSPNWEPQIDYEGGFKMDKEVIKSAIERAKECLLTAHAAFKISAYASAVSRAYYAMHDAGYAILLTKHIVPRKHSGLISKFHEHFIKPGILPNELGEWLKKGFQARIQADYEFSKTIKESKAKEIIELSEKFVTKIITWLTENNYLGE